MATHEQLKAFAATISDGPFGIAIQAPEPSAQPSRCFENVLSKVARYGGDCLFGWMFQLKISDVGEYFIAIHHAVWRAPDGFLWDVTPLHPDNKHHPLMEQNGTLFLVDRNSQPVTTQRMLAPLPIRFFALTDSAALASHVQQLEQKEIEACKRLYLEHA